MKLSLAVLLLVGQKAETKTLRNSMLLMDSEEDLNDFVDYNQRLLMIDQNQNQKKWDTQILSVIDEKAYVSDVKNILTT
jgi:hypothetical protein